MAGFLWIEVCCRRCHFIFGISKRCALLLYNEYFWSICCCIILIGSRVHVIMLLDTWLLKSFQEVGRVFLNIGIDKRIIDSNKKAFPRCRKQALDRHAPVLALSLLSLCPYLELRLSKERLCHGSSLPHLIPIASFVPHHFVFYTDRSDRPRVSVSGICTQFDSSAVKTAVSRSASCFRPPINSITGPLINKFSSSSYR